MPAPTISSVTATDSGSQVASYSANWPAVTAAGDLLLVVVSIDDTGGTSAASFDDATLTANTIYNTTDSTSLGGLAITYLISDGTEGGGTFTVNHSIGKRGGTYVYRILAAEWHGTTPPEEETQAVNTFNNDWLSQTITPSWDPSGDTNETLVIGIRPTKNGSLTISGYPTELSGGQTDDAFGLFAPPGMYRATADLSASSLTTTQADNVMSGSTGHYLTLIAIRGAAGSSTITGSGTPAAQGATASGNGFRALPGSGSLAIQAAAVAGAGTVTATLQLLLTQAAGRELRDENNALVANLANIVFEWYDDPASSDGNPTDQGTFSTDASGEATISITGSSLSAGQFGLLILYHPTDNAIRGAYYIPVS